MTLDNENQKLFLLEMFKQAQFSGQALDFAYILKQAIVNAEVTSTE